MDTIAQVVPTVIIYVYQLLLANGRRGTSTMPQYVYITVGWH